MPRPVVSRDADVDLGGDLQARDVEEIRTIKAVTTKIISHRPITSTRGSPIKARYRYELARLESLQRFGR
jgi:hypothetical protein